MLSYKTSDPVHDSVKLWPCSLALAEYIKTIDLKNKSVLDLGCGVGVVGITAALQGASVTMIDASEDACFYARLNSEDNNVNPRIINSRWQSLEESFDCVLSSETIYPSYLIETLADAIHRNWNRQGRCLLAVSSMCLWQARFQDAIKRYGLTVRTSELFHDGQPYQLIEVL